MLCSYFDKVCFSVDTEQGSCASLEFKASLEKSLNFIIVKKSLNCFGKRVEVLKSLEFAYVKLSTRL